MRLLQLLVLLFFVAVTRPCSGAIIAYSFQGTVSSLLTGGNPYGLSIPVGTSVSGQFVYDTTSAGTIVTASSTKYLQHQADGFVAQFGSHEFRASHYLVTVSNNLSGPSRDQIDISFRSDSLLASYPLYVNNAAQPLGVGQLVVALPFPNTEWSGTSLPVSLGPNPMSGSSLLGAPSPTVVLPKVVFTIESLMQLQLTNSVPEPGSGALALVGLAGAMGCLRSYRRRLRQ